MSTTYAACKPLPSCDSIVPVTQGQTIVATVSGCGPDFDCLGSEGMEAYETARRLAGTVGNHETDDIEGLADGGYVLHSQRIGNTERYQPLPIYISAAMDAVLDGVIDADANYDNLYEMRREGYRYVVTGAVTGGMVHREDGTVEALAA